MRWGRNGENEKMNGAEEEGKEGRKRKEGGSMECEWKVKARRERIGKTR